LSRSIRRILATPVATAAAVPGADRYRKHFSAEAHLWTLIYHGLQGQASLRQTHEALNDPLFWTRLGLPPTGISRSQLARSTSSRPLACFQTLFTQLRDRITTGGQGRKIEIVDSSFLALSAKLAPWSQHGKHAPGVRVHTGFDLDTAIPTHLTITGTETPDIMAFRQRHWDDLVGWTILMDRGYYGHRLFVELRDARISWICPLHPQAVFTVSETVPGPWPVTSRGDRIVADQTIRLGSPNNRQGAVIANLRLITSVTTDGQVHRTVTDRQDLPPTEVVMLYRHRWQIELFFRWIKHELQVLHPLGTSRQAVELTLVLAAIIAMLAVLLATDRPSHVTTIAWVKGLATTFLLTIITTNSS
jgi:hypothetical protein